MSLTEGLRDARPLDADEPVDGPTLANYCVGQSNRLAHWACRRAVRRSGAAYNPLFLYGPSGTGKSHLLAAIAQRLADREPQRLVEAMTGQQFAESYIRAAESDDLESFRAWFRGLDVLLIDDLEHVTRKVRTQEELYHTVNRLLEAGGRVVATARVSPRALPKLDPRLASRFMGGLQVKLDPPGPDLRVRILQAEARRRSVPLSAAAARLLATRLPGTARDLQGALNRLQLLAKVEGRTLGRATVEELLAEQAPDEPSSGLLEQIVHTVMRRYKLRLGHLQSKRRNRAVTLPRQLCMYLARDMTSLSLQEIGAYFGGRDHTTVLHACRKIQHLVEGDASIAGTVQEVRSDLQR